MKRKRSNSSPPKNSCLPPELLREVLARLPVKTLIKFRCVSKTWCCLIDSSDFGIMHHNNIIMNNIMNSQDPQFLLAAERCSKFDRIINVRRSNSFRKIASFGRVKSVAFLQSCYGLVMIRGNNDYNIKLWNPNIRKCIILPESPFKNKYSSTYHLGFAPSSNDYKVFASYFNEGALAVYSLNDRRWRVNYYDKNADNGLSCVYRYNDNSYYKVVSNGLNGEDCGLKWLLNRNARVVYCGRVMYWVQSCGDKLFAYDFDVEEFSSMQLPDEVKKSMVSFLFALGESVAVFTMSSKNSCIWVMAKVDGGEELWRLWFSGVPNSDVTNLLLSRCNDPSSPILSVQYLLKSNTFLIAYTNHMLQKESLMSYNITSQEMQHLGKSIRGDISLHTYAESLVLHRGFEGHNFISFP